MEAAVRGSDPGGGMVELVILTDVMEGLDLEAKAPDTGRTALHLACAHGEKVSVLSIRHIPVHHVVDSCIHPTHKSRLMFTSY